MILRADQIEQLLSKPKDRRDPIAITPQPVFDDEKRGAASIDIRLGCWFQVFRQTRVSHFDVYDPSDEAPSEAQLTKHHYVPFGKDYILHPRAFVLAVTLEWIRLPSDVAGYVIGRSSWGRHGLIIATATGVHPGFTGCLTLELTNVGEVPITIKPGTTICQLFLHSVDAGDPNLVDRSRFIGKRKPTIGSIKLDDVAKKLSLPML
ncbi:MAG: dCTP deaminase [Planctomycetaceae bacterium]|nr:dCTP deaminase [Planctomycetaceae bacterium]